MCGCGRRATGRTGGTSMVRPKVKIKRVAQTCWAFPAQWEATTADGRWVYIRYRGGLLQVGIGPTLDDAIDATWTDDGKGELLVKKQIEGADSPGEMSRDRMVGFTNHRLDWSGVLP